MTLKEKHVPIVVWLMYIKESITVQAIMIHETFLFGAKWTIETFHFLRNGWCVHKFIVDYYLCCTTWIQNKENMTQIIGCSKFGKTLDIDAMCTWQYVCTHNQTHTSIGMRVIINMCCFDDSESNKIFKYDKKETFHTLQKL